MPKQPKWEPPPPPTMWDQWPPGIPRPTEEQMTRARERHRKDMDEAVKRGYSGDMLCGLEFTMTTYSLRCWWEYFEPDVTLSDEVS